MTSGPLRSEPDPITGVSIPLNPDGSTDWPTFAGELRSGHDEVTKPARPKKPKPLRPCLKDDADTGLRCQLLEGHDPPHVAVVEWTDFHPEDEALIEAYLSFLRGTGPCPDISALATESQQRMREQFAILAALTARDAGPDVPTEARS